MAPGNGGGWLSFSVSPLEMLPTCHQSQLWPGKAMMLYGSSYPDLSSTSSSRKRLSDAFRGDQWPTAGAPIPCKEGNAAETDHPLPKVEDFLANHIPSMAQYPRTIADTAPAATSDPLLCSMYGRDVMMITAAARTKVGFAEFPASSSSEGDDSTSATGNRPQGYSFSDCSPESRTEPALSDAARGLTLVASQAFEKTSEVALKKVAADASVQRTSVYRGVTRHRWTGRYEAHLWDNSCRREGQVRKGRQVYLGGYDKEEKAARAYDLAALKYWGMTATTNFPVSDYNREIEEMKNVSKQEFIASLRRKSSGFSRGASIYRGVTRHHQQGRWQARIGRVAGNKDLYLGTFATEEEAAEAYDIAAIKFRGVNAVTNFEISRYNIEAIANSALPIGAAAKRLKQHHAQSLQTEEEHRQHHLHTLQTEEEHHHHHLAAAAAAAAAPNASPPDCLSPTLFSGEPTATPPFQNLFQHHHPMDSAVGSFTFGSIGPNVVMYPPYGCLTTACDITQQQLTQINCGVRRCIQSTNADDAAATAAN